MVEDQHMDLQGVGAITAAAVAAVSIPISALVGRWQMRGAVETAEATYKAAVDAARNQAASTHAQWRRGVQRDAYAALLVASQQVRNVVIHRIAGDAGDGITLSEQARAELYAARTALQTTYAVTMLEGSSLVREAADELREAAFEVAAQAEATDARQRAMGYLNRKEEEEERLARNSGASESLPGPWGHAKGAFMALVALAVSSDNGSATGAEYGVAWFEFREAFAALPIDQAPQALRDTLGYIAMSGETLRERMSNEVDMAPLQLAIDKFVDAARAELNSPFVL
ncbi:hypothetical protein [Streptomyces sp. NPDC002078]